eukprot:15934892-Heterocapsa_arctica.AAC.1
MRVPPDGKGQIPGYMTHSSGFEIFKVSEPREHLCGVPCDEGNAARKGSCTGSHDASWYFNEAVICFPEKFREVVGIEPFCGTFLCTIWVPWSWLVFNVSIVEKVPNPIRMVPAEVLVASGCFRLDGAVGHGQRGS